MKQHLILPALLALFTIVLTAFQCGKEEPSPYAPGINVTGTEYLFTTTSWLKYYDVVGIDSATMPPSPVYGYTEQYDTTQFNLFVALLDSTTISFYLPQESETGFDAKRFFGGHQIDFNPPLEYTYILNSSSQPAVTAAIRADSLWNISGEGDYTSFVFGTLQPTFQKIKLNAVPQ